MYKVGSIVLVALALVPAMVVSSDASQRRFTYTYESLVLNPGEVELEPWTTFRIGKEDYFSRIDHRLEFEVGVTSNIQTAFYLNMHATTAQVDSTLDTEFEWGGISNEWKFKLRDPVADPFGLALYFEWGASTTEVELEAKVIVDKRFDKFLVAFNAVVEPEWEFEIEGGNEVEAEHEETNLEFDLAGAYFVTPRTALGVEVRNHNGFVPGEGHEFSALFAGPVVSYASDTWWGALTVLPQVAKLKGSEEDEGNDLVLSEHEKLEIRLLFGFDI